jgi:hypothetical protein
MSDYIDKWDDPNHNPMDDIEHFLRWTCMHNHTTEPDENGDAICFRCGTVIQIRFNMDRFRAAIKKIYEDDGSTK